MNNKDLVSVIIPVYNVEEYLPQCLNSVLNQAYKNIEILIVDDGATDASGDICDEYALKDPRIKVIHKANGGLSSARNTGMLHAKGEWVFFIDSDDWIDPETISSLQEFAIRNQCDMVQCNHYYAHDTYFLYRAVSKTEKKVKVLTRQEAMRQLIINDRLKNFAWGKLYKFSLIKDLGFPEGKFFEDSFWQHHVIHACARYGIIDEPLYFYRQRKDSISGSFSEKMFDLLEGNKCRLKFIQNHYPELTDLMANKYQELKKNISGPSCDKPTFSLGVLLTKLYNRVITLGKYKKVRI